MKGRLQLLATVLLALVCHSANASPFTPKHIPSDSVPIYILQVDTGNGYEEFVAVALIGYCGGDPVNRIDPMGTNWAMLVHKRANGVPVEYEIFWTNHDDSASPTSDAPNEVDAAKLMAIALLNPTHESVSLPAVNWREPTPVLDTARKTLILFEHKAWANAKTIAFETPIAVLSGGTSVAAKMVRIGSGLRGVWGGVEAGYNVFQTGELNAGDAFVIVMAFLDARGVKLDASRAPKPLKFNRPSNKKPAEISPRDAQIARKNARIATEANNLDARADIFDGLNGRNLTTLTNKQVGDLGEDVTKKWLRGNGYTDIVSLQNSRGNGIDVIARGADGKLAFFEVKSSRIGDIGELSPTRQANGADWFVNDVLPQASRGTGRYRSLNQATQDLADRILTEIRRSSEPVRGSAVGIDLMNQTLKVSPWRD